jgi:hypothetical protein
MLKIVVLSAKSTHLTCNNPHDYFSTSVVPLAYNEVEVSIILMQIVQLHGEFFDTQ